MKSLKTICIAAAMILLSVSMASADFEQAMNHFKSGKYAEAAEIHREVFLSATRLLGAEHEEALVTAKNLANSLAGSGQKTEAEQLLRDTLVLPRDTLALSRCALGPNHKHTQNLLRNLCALGLAA